MTWHAWISENDSLTIAVERGTAVEPQPGGMEQDSLRRYPQVAWFIALSTMLFGLLIIWGSGVLDKRIAAFRL